MVLTRKLLTNIVVGIAFSPLALAQDQGAVADQASALLRQGQQLALANRLAEAEVSLTKAMAIAPTNDQVLTLLAEVKSRLGEASEAVQLFRKVVLSQPGSAEAHLNLALALADSGNTNEAISETEQSLRIDPGDARAHLNRARLLADAKRPIEARAEFARAERFALADPQVDYFWAVFEKENHHPSAAASLLAKVVARQPDNTRALLTLGTVQQQLGHEQEAIAAWRQVLAVDPSSQEAVYALAQALKKTQPDEAAQLLQQFNSLHAEKQREEQVRELGNQAYAEMQRQNWPAAVTALQQAIALCASCSLAADLHQRLGVAECNQGDLASGEHELRLALSLDPNNRQATAALQWVAEKNEEKQAAPHTP